MKTYNVVFLPSADTLNFKGPTLFKSSLVMVEAMIYYW